MHVCIQGDDMLQNSIESRETLHAETRANGVISSHSPG